MNHGTRQADTLSVAGRLGWLRLIRSEIVGPIVFHQVPNQFGTVGAALDALPNLARRGGGGRRMISVYTTAAAVGARPRVSCEVAYPSRLGALSDPPPLIYVLGDPARLAVPVVSIVGARNASAAAIRYTRRLARDLGGAGLWVAFGLARGIDTAAHAVLWRAVPLPSWRAASTWSTKRKIKNCTRRLLHRVPLFQRCRPEPVPRPTTSPAATD